MDWETAVKQADELFSKAIPKLMEDPTGGKGMPTYSRADTTEIDYDRERVRSQREVVSATIGEELQNYGTANEAEKKAIQAKGVAESDLAYAAKEQADREAAIFAQYGQIFGVTPENMASLVHDMNIQKPKLVAQGTEIAGMQAVGPGDNLLEWWGNQFALPGKIQEYNTRASTYNMMQDTLDSYIKSANDAATFAHKGIPSISAATAKAKSDVALANAAQASAQADENLAKVNVTFQTQKLAADVAAAEKTLQTTELEVRQRQNELQAAIHAIQFSENQAMRMLRAAELAEKLAKNEDEMAQRKSIGKILENYDRVTGKPLGTTSFDVWRVSGEAVKNNMIAIGTGSLGATPVAAAMNWYASRPGPLASPDTERLMGYIAEKTRRWMTDQHTQTMDEKQKIDYVNIHVNTEIKQDIANASTLGSMFYELSPAKLIAAGQMNPDSVVAKVLQPLTQGKMSENILTELVVDTIRKAFNNDNDAAKAIADYYQRNIALRNSTMNTGLANLALPNSYDVPVKLGFFSSKNLDLTKFNDVMKFLQVKSMHEYRSAQEPPAPGSQINITRNAGI